VPNRFVSTIVKYPVFKKVPVILLGLFGVLAVIRRTGNCVPLAPPRRYTPVCMVSKSSDFCLCSLILNSHSIRTCICLRLKFNNQQNARTPLRCTISICVLHCSYFFLLNFLVILHICATFEGCYY